MKRAALLALTLLAACSRRPPPSLLLVSIDTLRADAVSAWGREIGTTPHLDALAAEGTRFANATGVTPLTLPAHASLLTGLRPARHGLTVNGAAGSLPVPTIAQRLAERGYATAAFVSASVLAARFGVSAGFQHYDDELHVPGGPPAPTERRGDATVDAALAWAGWSAPSFCAWVHLYDPHAPYAAPGGHAGQDRQAYLDEVRFADSELARLLDGVAARARGEVLVVVVSDHGEGLGEHGEATHGLLLHEATMHVPLVMAWLNGGEGFPRAGEVRTDVVSLLDVAPTVAEVLGLPPEPDLDGSSVVQPRPGRALPLEARAPWVYYGFSPLVGVRRDGTKLVGAPEARPPGWIRYDLVADPGETAGVPAAQDPLCAAAPDPHPAHEAAAAMSDADLAALGYVSARPPAPSAGPHDDPRLRMDLIAALDAANTDVVEGRPQAVLDRLPAPGAPDGDVPEVLLQRGRALRALGRLDEAVASLRRAAASRPGPELLTELGAALLQREQAQDGDGAQAAAALDAALALAPDDPHALALRGLCELLAGKPQAALDRVQAALQRSPRDGELLLVQLRALRGLQRDDRAAAEALRAVWPDCPELR